MNVYYVFMNGLRYVGVGVPEEALFTVWAIDKADAKRLVIERCRDDGFIEGQFEAVDFVERFSELELYGNVLRQT